MSRGILLCACLILLGLVPLSHSELSDGIGITLSDSCITLIKLNSDACPAYDTIWKIFPDTTNHAISGGFDFVDGMYQRENDHLTKHYEYYRYHNLTQWIDPPADASTRIKTITIHPALPSYAIANSSAMHLEGDEFSRFLGHTRHVTPNCMSAQITSQNWMLVLGDTINFMKNDCDESFTNLDTIQKMTKQKTMMSITTSQYHFHKMWLQQIKENCIFEYGVC